VGSCWTKSGPQLNQDRVLSTPQSPAQPLLRATQTPLGLGSVSAQVKAAAGQVWKRNGHLERSVLTIVYGAFLCPPPFSNIRNTLDVRHYSGGHLDKTVWPEMMVLRAGYATGEHPVINSETENGNTCPVLLSCFSNWFLFLVLGLKQVELQPGYRRAPGQYILRECRF
jgi:hypothetical protein